MAKSKKENQVAEQSPAKDSTKKTLMNVGMCINCANWARRDKQPLIEKGKHSILGNCKAMLPAVIGHEGEIPEAVSPGNEEIADHAPRPQVITGVVKARRSNTSPLEDVEVPAVILRTRKMPCDFMMGMYAIVTSHEFGCVNFVPKGDETVTMANAVTLSN